MPDVAWRTVPLHHLTWFQRLQERILGGTFLWCPETTSAFEFDRSIRRAGR